MTDFNLLPQSLSVYLQNVPEDCSDLIDDLLPTERAVVWWGDRLMGGFPNLEQANAFVGAMKKREIAGDRVAEEYAKYASVLDGAERDSLDRCWESICDIEDRLNGPWPGPR